MTKEYSRRGSASSLFGGVDCLVRSSTSINTTNSWPFASNPSSSKNNNKSSHPDSNGSSDITAVTSISTLSSMLDDEELWAEFKTELEASNIKTGLGIQGMLSKFLAAKGMEEQQKKDQEDAKQQEQMMDGHNSNELLSDVSSTASVGSRRRNHRDSRKSDFGVLHSRGSTTISGATVSKTGKVIRRFSSNISASFAAEVEKEADDNETLWAMHKRRRDSGIVGGGNGDRTVLPGRRVSVDHDDIHPYPGGLRRGDRGDSAHWMPNPNNSDNHDDSGGNTHEGMSITEDNYHITPRDKGSPIKECRTRTVLSRSCPQNIFSSSVQRGSGITNGLDQRLSQSCTSAAMIPKEEETNVSSSSPDNAPNIKKMFKDWFVALSKERQGSANSDSIIDESVNGDQTESKSTSDRNYSDVMNPGLTPYWTAAYSEGGSVQEDDDTSPQPSFKDWFGSLGGETHRGGSVKDSIDGSVDYRNRNKQKPSVRRNDHYDATLRDSGLCLNNTASGGKRQNRGEQNEVSQYVDIKSSNLKASKSCDMNQDDDITMHDMTDIRNVAVSFAQQQASHSMRSCLKQEGSSKNCGMATPSSYRSSTTLTSLDDEDVEGCDDDDDDDGQDTANLLHLLLSLDCGPSKECVKKKATTSSSQFSSSTPPRIAEEKKKKEDEKKKEGVAKNKMTMQQGTLATSLSQPSSSDPPCIAEGKGKKNPNEQDRAEEIEKELKGAATVAKMTVQQRAPPLDPTSCSISADFLLSMNTSQVLSSNYQEENKKNKEGVTAMTMMQQGTPPLDPTSRSISADFFLSKNKSCSSSTTFKYQPLRKHANKELRRRQVRALQDDVVNRSTTTELTNRSSGSISMGSDEARKQHVQSIMSMGSIPEIRKRNIRVVDSDTKHLDWSSCNGNTAAFTLQRPSGASTILPSKRNGNNPSSMMQNSPLQMMPSSNSAISIKDRKELRQMQVRTPQDNIANRSMTTEVTNFTGSSDDSNNALSRNIKGTMSTGSMMDMQKQHIPVSKNQYWSSVDWSSQKELLKNEAQSVPTSLQRHPQAMVPSCMPNTKNQNTVSMCPSEMLSSVFPNKKDGNNTSPSKMQSSPPPTMISSADSILSMMSTGSTKDMRRRHIPTMTMSAMMENRERGSTICGTPTVDWGATICHGNHGPVFVLDRPQPTGNAYLNRETVVDVLSTADSTNDMISKLGSIPKTAVATMERQNQGRQSGAVQGAPSSRQQQQPVDKAPQAALQRIRDMKARHLDRQLQMASGGAGDNSSINDNSPMKTKPSICGIDFRRHQTAILSSSHEREHAVKQLKMAQVHPLPVVKPKNKDKMPSLSLSNRTLVAATATKQESITMLEYIQKKHEFENKRAQVRSQGGVRGASAGSSSAQKEIAEAKSNNSAGASNAGFTDLFQRYLENKASNGDPCEMSSANSKDDTSPLRAYQYNSVAHTLTAPRGSAANTSKAMAVGQLLLDWGDTPTASEKDGEYTPVLAGIFKCEYRQEPCIPEGEEKKKERQKETGVWTGSNQIVGDRCITVNPNEIALRRVSDITTYSFDESEDDLAMMSGYPQEEEEEPTTQSLALRNEAPAAPALAFKKKMRSLSIAEEPLEEEDFDDW